DSFALFFFKVDSCHIQSVSRCIIASQTRRFRWASLYPEQMQISDEEALRQECWQKRFYSFGTTKIFERRARDLGWKRRIITFLGLAAPLAVGAVAVSFSTDSAILKYIALPTAAIVTIFQAIISL